MDSVLPHQALVAPRILLDGRLALFHTKERWLAVADLHFGYEISQRAAGRLVPLWGMATVEERLNELLAEYRPRRLVVVGDLVHDRTAAGEAHAFLERLGAKCEVVLLAGNHDRHLTGSIPMQESWRAGKFLFHHGHCSTDATGMTQIIGHHHPAGSVRDGAGLRLKLPAFVQQGSCWILPAFSPWASGAAWRPEASSRIWLCTPKRILRLPDAEAAAS